VKLNLDIQKASPQAWIDCVINNFDEFLKDHADCERKASAMAMSFIAKYPDRKEIIPELIETALEELEHFQQVYKIMEDRGISLPATMAEDPYIKALLKSVRTGLQERFLDRILIASVAETRGAERFRLVEEHLQDPEMKKFYKMLWTSEAKHGHIYIKMALNYFPSEIVYSRLEFWLAEEAKVIEDLQIRPALH
jgi:tRNA-(ms[2]io[6]A)-hydroxylase